MIDYFGVAAPGADNPGQPPPPREDTLAACTFAVVDAALRAHAVFPRFEGGRS